MLAANTVAQWVRKRFRSEPSWISRVESDMINSHPGRVKDSPDGMRISHAGWACVDSGTMTESAATELNARASGTFDIKDLGPVHRLGFGAMRITGPGVWGEPADREVARDVVRRAVEWGVDFIDTADSYGPAISEEIIAEALHPYPSGLRIATKAGFVRTGPNQWHMLGRPEYLRQQVELSLRRLKVDVIDLFQLHRIDPAVPADDQFGVLKELQDEGKVRALGLSQVSVEDI